MNYNRTDLVKVGKYIANLRKNKNYTQRQLSEILDVSDKTISKWENGVVAPDITILKELANTFGVSVDEILCGEKIIEFENKNNSLVNGILFYLNKEKTKFLKYFFIIILLIVSLFFCYTYINNYYKWRVYYLSSSNKEFFVNGYVVSNPEKNIFIFDKFDYLSNNLGTDSEPKILELSISLYYDDQELINNKKIYNDYMLLHNCLENYYIIYEEKNNNNFKVDKIKIMMSFVTSDNEKYNLLIKLK